jgi:hypothetical protein
MSTPHETPAHDRRRWLALVVPVAGYGLGFAAVLITGGRLGDIYGASGCS